MICGRPPDKRKNHRATEIPEIAQETSGVARGVCSRRPGLRQQQEVVYVLSMKNKLPGCCVPLALPVFFAWDSPSCISLAEPVAHDIRLQFSRAHACQANREFSGASEEWPVEPALRYCVAFRFRWGTQTTRQARKQVPANQSPHQRYQLLRLSRGRVCKATASRLRR